MVRRLTRLNLLDLRHSNRRRTSTVVYQLIPQILSPAGMHFEMRILPQVFELHKRFARTQIL